jgi:hypothetical protein
MGPHRRDSVYAGDWILDLLGTTMVVGSGLTVVAGSAILFALVHAAGGAGGLARFRSFPPPGVTGHADEVRERLRHRYMARVRRLNELAAARAVVAFTIEPGDARIAVAVRGPEAELSASTIEARSSIPIAKLPPLNESLRRSLTTRRAKLTERPPAPRRTRARKARRTRVKTSR